MRARRGWARRRRPGGRRAWAPVLVGVVLAGASACASRADEDPVAAGADRADETREPGETRDDDVPGDAGGATGEQPADFEATARYLDKVADQSTAEPHRIEMSMAIRATGSRPGEQLDVEAPLLTGEQDGNRYEIHMDMGRWIDELAQSAGERGLPPGLDFSMDMAGDDQTLYMRAPFFAQIIEEAPPSAEVGAVEDLAVLADGWGRIDLTRLGGFSLGEAQQTMGGPAGSDPRVLLEIVADAQDVEDLGAQTVDGTMAHGLGARLSMADMLEAQGTDPEDFVNQMAGGLGAGPGLDGEAAAERVLALEIPFEAWVDAEGYVRRVSYEMDMVAMLGNGIDSGIGAGAPEEFVLGTTMDFSDYGDESIAIEFPADALDVTDAYHQLLMANAAAAAAASGDPQGS